MSDDAVKNAEKQALEDVSKEEAPGKGAESEREGSRAAREPKKEKKEFTIDIFSGWCKGCGICAAFCPRQCIEMDLDGTPHVVQPERCTGCGFCEVHCPDFAISVRPKKKAVGDEV